MSDIDFVNGLIFKEPRSGAPDYVKGSISIKREDLITWLQSRSGDWINADVKESKGGKIYVAVNDWKPPTDRPAQRQESRGGGKPAQHDDFEDSTIPF